MNHYTYLITHKVTGMMYIGKRSCQCTILEDRYTCSSKDKDFRIELKEYPENFDRHIMSEHESAAEALAMEIYLHSMLDVGVNPNFYNKAKQTTVGFDRTGVPIVGRILSNATKLKIRSIKLGVPRNSITCQKISAARMGKFAGRANPMFGNRHSPESKLRMKVNRGSLSGKNNPRFRKDLNFDHIQFLRNTGAPYKEIAKILNCGASTIERRLKKGQINE